MKLSRRRHILLKSFIGLACFALVAVAIFGVIWGFALGPFSHLSGSIPRQSHQIISTPQPSKKKSTPAASQAPAQAAMVPDYTIPAAENGLAPVLYKIPTKLPVVYLGIDDGANKTQQEVDLLAQNHIKASLFLSDLFIASNPDFFKAIIAQGSVVEDHTLHHNINMKDEPYAYQKAEICGMADHELQYYGHRPTLFRPPGGAYSDTMRRAAHDCGMNAVVTWIAKANGGAMQYQVGDHLNPGDIVLMHFRPEFAQDLQAFVNAETAVGLHTELLEDLPVAG